MCLANESDKPLLEQQLEYTHHLLVNDFKKNKKYTARKLHKIIVRSIISILDIQSFVLDIPNSNSPAITQKYINKKIIAAYAYGLKNIVGLKNLPDVAFNLTKHRVIADNIHLMSYQIVSGDEVHYTISYTMSQSEDGKWLINNFTFNDMNLLLAWRKLSDLKELL